MGRIVAQLEVTNLRSLENSIVMDALVDTGASLLVLPLAWRERLGELDELEKVEMERSTQTFIEAIICGPVKIKIEGFRTIYDEVAFVDMQPVEGRYEPLLGYIPLEKSQAAVDMIGHRLVKVKNLDLK